MTTFKPDFLKSSASESSTDKSFLNGTSESSCDGTPSANLESKPFFMLRRRRNNSQSQPLLDDLGQWSPSASPPNLLAEIPAALAITSNKSTSTSNQQLAASVFHHQPQQQQTPPAGIQASPQTGGKLLAHRVTGHFEMTERVTTIEAFDSMEKYNQFFQESEILGRKTTKRQERSDLNSSIDITSTLSPKIADSPQPYITRHVHEQHLRIKSVDQRYEVSELRRILEILQRAARQLQADQSMSQPNIFRSLAPLAMFLYLLGIGLLFLRQQRYRHSQTPEENTSIARMILSFFIGMVLALVVLRGMVWFVGVCGKALCEVDLTQIFKKGECVDVNGRGIGEAELIVGGMFM